MDLKSISAKPLAQVPVGTESSPRGSWLEFLLAAAVGLLALWFLVLPKQGVVSDLSSRASKLEQQQAEFTRNRQITDQLIAKLSASTEQVDKLDEAIPLDLRTTKVRYTLETLAKSLDIQLSSAEVAARGDEVVAGSSKLSGRPFSGSRQLKTVPASIEFTATVAQAEAFLQKIETSGRFLQVTSLEVNAKEDNRPSFRVNLNAYAFAE